MIVPWINYRRNSREHDKQLSFFIWFHQDIVIRCNASASPISTTRAIDSTLLRGYFERLPTEFSMTLRDALAKSHRNRWWGEHRLVGCSSWIYYYLVVQLEKRYRYQLLEIVNTREPIRWNNSFGPLNTTIGIENAWKRLNYTFTSVYLGQCWWKLIVCNK